ncbi:MAG: hypothetical protein M3N23_00150 [Pseudomonadota bacterium]|nr:hypothetical protein [Pseudomonadota bacterium]
MRSLRALFKYGANGNLTPHTGGNSLVIAHTHAVLHREASKTYSASGDGLSAIANVYDFN